VCKYVEMMTRVAGALKRILFVSVGLAAMRSDTSSR
jgi:hypothetical protein